jgi:hypothetical protein
MPTLSISGVTHAGVILAPQALHSPAEALAKLRELRHSGSRAWVTDEEGNDVSEQELERRAND